VPLLSVRHASKRYHGVPALIDAALDLHAGEVHALVGENGAGKSTLIKLLAGVLAPDALEVRLRGEPVTLRGAQDAYAAGLRFIHQELNVVPQLSVAENIFLSQPYPRRGGIFVDWRTLNARARAVLARLGVDHIPPGTPMARLSPGNQMLVKIASAFAGEDANGGGAWVYVMDEPTAALTGQEVETLFAVIERLKAQGRAILYVSHRLDEIFQIAARVTVMRDGRVVANLPITATTPDDLIRQMTGRDLQQVYPPRESAIGADVRLTVADLSSAAIHEVSFEQRAGEILGVAGLSGAGRTELLRAVIGADRRLGGEITLAGSNNGWRSPAGAWEQGIAFVPEERRSQGLILSRGISDNVSLPHLGHLSRGRVFLDRVRERAASVQLGESVRLKAAGPGQIVRQLSGGNQQKVVFARALARPPRLLLLDEPTRGVDVGAKVDIYRLIRQISAQGTAILLASSELPELLGLCDRILVLRRGHLVDVVPAAGLTEDALLALCYGEIPHDDRAITD
jgi:ribose transport system ATP-binding protein